MAKLTHRGLRSIRARWERDLAVLVNAFPAIDYEASGPETETIRNLQTAIAEIDGIITAITPLNRRHKEKRDA